MKVRNGFVSNSSSSSFIVAFDKVPESVDEMREMLFGEEKYFYSPYDKAHWDAQKIAEIVFNDLQGQSPLTQLQPLFSTGYISGEPEYPWTETRRMKYDSKEYEDIMKRWKKELEKFREEKTKEFMDKVKESKLFIFEYSDNDGTMYSAMEHGGLFDRLLHKRISHH